MAKKTNNLVNKTINSETSNHHMKGIDHLWNRCPLSTKTGTQSLNWTRVWPILTRFAIKDDTAMVVRPPTPDRHTKTNQTNQTSFYSIRVLSAPIWIQIISWPQINSKWNLTQTYKLWMATQIVPNISCSTTSCLSCLRTILTPTNKSLNLPTSVVRSFLSQKLQTLKT